MRREGARAVLGTTDPQVPDPILGSSQGSGRQAAPKLSPQPHAAALGAPRGAGCREGAVGPCSPHLCQLQVGQGADQLPREGDNRLRLALERCRTAGEGQQPHGKRGQEDECHGAAVAGKLWLCQVPAALL